jgi:hypothetical protein
MTMRKLKSSPIFFGIAVAILASALPVIFRNDIPLAYGICTVCHARDLLGWVLNHVTRFEMDSPLFASTALVLTPIGLVAGSFVASKRNAEFKLIRISSPISMFFSGVLVSMFGLVIMSCPTRIILRTAVGDTVGLLAAAGLFGGIALAVLAMKRIR